MIKIKIKSIKKLEEKRPVYDLTVQENHNFFIGHSSILTHNCDYMTPNAQAALRNMMETFSQHTRFILTCNYIEKIMDAITSRSQMFQLTPPSKKDVAVHLTSILTKENVTYDPKAIALLVNSMYPDIRRIINTAQLQSVDGELKINQSAMIDSDYKLKILEILKDGSIDKATAFKSIRQIIADNSISDFSDFYKLIYDNIDSFAKGHIAQVTLLIAENEYKSAFCVDKEIAFMALIIQLLSEIK